MAPSLADTLRDWRDFYILVGTASATLVGLMFVAASIGASAFSDKRRNPLRAFLTPTVAHFAAVFFACMLLTMPGHSPLSLGSLLGAGALVGLPYCGWIFAIVVRNFSATLDWDDRIFYALLPGLGYLALLAAAGTVLVGQPAGGAKLIAAAFVILLASGLRNAWDVMVWVSVRLPNTIGSPPESDGGS